MDLKAGDALKAASYVPMEAEAMERIVDDAPTTGMLDNDPEFLEGNMSKAGLEESENAQLLFEHELAPRPPLIAALDVGAECLECSVGDSGDDEHAR
jgi:hypothetical protein